jgi:hypothetical protein
MNQIQNNLNQLRQSLNNLNQKFSSLSKTIDQSFQHLNNCERAAQSVNQNQFSTTGTSQYQGTGTTGQTSMTANKQYTGQQPYGVSSMSSNMTSQPNAAYKSQGGGWNPQEDRVAQTPITSTRNRDADIGSAYYNTKPSTPTGSQYTGMNYMNNQNQMNY